MSRGKGLGGKGLGHPSNFQPAGICAGIWDTHRIFSLNQVPAAFTNLTRGAFPMLLFRSPGFGRAAPFSRIWRGSVARIWDTHRIFSPNLGMRIWDTHEPEDLRIWDTHVRIWDTHEPEDLG